MNSLQEVRREYKQYMIDEIIRGHYVNLLLNEIKENSFEIVLKAKRDQCTMHILPPTEKKEEFLVIAHDTTSTLKTVLTKMFKIERVWILDLLADILRTNSIE